MAEIGERDRFERKTIMSDQRRGSHTVPRLTVHLVWVTKYRYPVLKGEIQKRCRELIIQICDTEDVKILKGVVSQNHVQMHIEYPPSKSIRDLVRRIKGRVTVKVRWWYFKPITSPLRNPYSCNNANFSGNF